jgi:two-component system, OmpR family, phosphate regulon sensor histidine kinase PhoR
MNMFYNLRTRIGFLYTLLIILVMGGIAIYITKFIKDNYLLELQERLESEARLASQIVLPVMENSPDSEMIDLMAKKISLEISARVTIIALDGKVIGDSAGDKESMENHANRPEIVQARLTGKGSERRPSETLGYDMYYVAVRIENEGKRFGFARIGISLELLDTKIKQLQRTLLGVTILLTLVTSLIAVWISNRTTRSLRELSQAAEQIAKGDLSTRLIPSSKDEIGVLTQTFNTMAVQMDERLRDLETERSMVSAVLKAMSDGVMIVDPENRMKLANQAAQTIFSISGNQVMNRSVFEFVHHHQIEKILMECRNIGEARSILLDYPNHRQSILATATPLGSGQAGNILLVFQDLTERHRLETVRRDFIANISHELRTPIASLKALAETLIDGALEDPEVNKKFLQRMEIELDSLSQMVNEVLELSRIESGSLPLLLSEVSACNLIEDVVERLSVQAERAKLNVKIECHTGVPLVKADPDRIAQVLVNLMHNAIKFTPEGGKITVGAEEEEGMLRFYVQDTGSGIPSSDLNRIFERFYKTDPARSSSGTGLGLAIARHLVEAHHGKIWAESIEGRGSTFIFLIPIASTASQR